MKQAKIWNNGKIPAVLFFDILQTEKLKKLVRKKGTLEVGRLEDSWSNIYDEYFEMKKDIKLDLILKTKEHIRSLMASIEVAKPILFSICKVEFNKDQLKELKETLSGLGFEIDLDNLLDSVLMILQSDIPSMETRIEIEKDNLKNLTKGEASTFEENCVAYESAGFSIKEDCSLRRYVAYESAALQKYKSVKNGK